MCNSNGSRRDNHSLNPRPHRTHCHCFPIDVLQSGLSWLEAAGQGTTFVELGRHKLKAERIPLPDLATQGRIADFLDRKTATIDELIEKTDASVDLWKEYRAALITAAVTGQIDTTTWKGHTGHRPAPNTAETDVDAEKTRHTGN
ncbi:MAG: restriction endonuclease subunit S [Hyphomonadaceae bacterium]|nr:restriction endonuclease subunit S [Hyphomonadaceae bacterium]